MNEGRRTDVFSGPVERMFWLVAALAAAKQLAVAASMPPAHFSPPFVGA